MLLNDFKTGVASSAAASSSLRGLRTRNGVAVRKLVPVRATAAGGDAGKVRGAFSTILGLSTKEAHGPDMVVYQGKVTIMKKLLALDLMDRRADIQDDASELRGKKVSLQLVSNEVDSSTHSTSPMHLNFLASHSMSSDHPIRAC
jgi:hypothetical protein